MEHRLGKDVGICRKHQLFQASKECAASSPLCFGNQWEFALSVSVLKLSNGHTWILLPQRNKPYAFLLDIAGYASHLPCKAALGSSYCLLTVFRLLWGEQFSSLSLLKPPPPFFFPLGLDLLIHQVLLKGLQKQMVTVTWWPRIFRNCFVLRHNHQQNEVWTFSEKQ